MRHRRRQKHLLQVVEELSIVWSEETYGLARFSSSTRATNAMGVRLDGLGHVVVDDERDVLDVDTTSGNVRRHQDVLVSSLEPRKSVFSLLLTFAAVQRGRVVAHLLQTLGQDVGSLLLIDEDDDRRLDAAVQDFDQLVAFVVLLHQVDGLFDSLDRLSDAADVNDGRSTQIRSES